MILLKTWLLFLSTIAVHGFVVNLPSHPLVPYEVVGDVSFQKPSLLCARAAGFKSMVADVLWFQLLCATPQLQQRSCQRSIVALAEKITDFDPHFNVVYRFAANAVLPYLPACNLYTDLQKLLQKGLALRCNVDDWRLHFQLSFAHVHGAGDYKKAYASSSAACAVVPEKTVLKRFYRSVPPYVLAWHKYLEKRVI